MNDDGPIALYDWILREFTAEGASQRVSHLGPHLARLVATDHQILDLCCGTGPFAFYLEEHGARVTAIDAAPVMIRAAREEASKRNSKVDFVLADVLAYDLGTARFDLSVLLGNTVSDFPLSAFAQLVSNVHQALKRNGRFAIQYTDGLHQFIQGGYPTEGVQQEEPERITRRFKEYVPEQGAYVEVYKNEVSGEEYEYTSYVYMAPVVRAVVDGRFDLEESIRVNERSFLDIFRRR